MSKKPQFYSFEKDAHGDTITITYDKNRRIIGRTTTYNEDFGHQMVKGVNESAQHISHQGAATGA